MNSCTDNLDWLDGSLYPDRPVPGSLETPADRVDFIVRVCGAWDFGVMPWPATVRQLLDPTWRQAVDEAQLLTSCAYHLLRELHGLPPLPYLGPRFPQLEADPCLKMM